MNYLKKIRVALALFFGIVLTLLFLDFTGFMHQWFGWMARIQLVPAILALNLVVVVALLLMTLLMGRLYCSIICPMGIFQDVIARMNRKKNPYSWSPALRWLRYGFLVLFVAALLAGIGSLVALLEPYSAYGRIVSNLLAPLWQWGNNLVAAISERAGSYAFYETEVWLRSIPVFLVACFTLVIVSVLAWKNGRTYCNTVCPVGTFLGIISRWSLLKPRIETEKCNGCGLCARNCKAACIDSKNHQIDYSRCVTCFDCITVCRKEAIRYGMKVSVQEASELKAAEVAAESADTSRRKMMTVGGALLATSVLRAQTMKVDGGLAYIEDKKIPLRQTGIVPPGARSHRNFNRHCTGCQLCVSVCPNHVLRPSDELETLMQPRVSYERGYCRPECNRCSDVCPAGAIQPVTTADKSAIQVGHAVWVEQNCVVLTDGVTCGNCARHCPAGAISMIDREADNPDAGQIPVVNTERCIGCGACEHLCPARPFSAIYVEGHLMHRTV